MLGEDEHLLLGKANVGDDFAELVELRLHPGVVDVLGELAESHHLFAFGDELRQGFGNNALKQCVFGGLVLFQSLVGALFVGCLRLENIVVLFDATLEGQQLLDGEAAGLNVLDDLVEFADTTPERTQQRVGRTGQAALEHAHGQAGGRLVEYLGLVVHIAQVVGGLVV